MCSQDGIAETLTRILEKCLEFLYNDGRLDYFISLIFNKVPAQIGSSSPLLTMKYL